MQICIPHRLHQKVMHLIRRDPRNEITGFGNIEIDSEGLTVQSVFLMPQTVSGGAADIEAVDVARAMRIAAQSGKPGTMRWWWHSHAKMDVFWSNTDRETITELAKAGWFAASVFNVQGEVLSGFWQGTPVPIVLSDIPTVIGKPAVARKTLDEWNAEFDENVTKSPVRWDKEHWWDRPEIDTEANEVQRLLVRDAFNRGEIG